MIYPMNDFQFTGRLRNIVGQRFQYLGKNWMAIDILPDEGRLVLAASDAGNPIQADQYGQPTRRSPETLMIPLYGETEETLSEELLELLANRC
jgi:hypothetical protein